MATTSIQDDALRRAQTEAQSQQTAAESGVPENFTPEEWTRATGQPAPQMTAEERQEAPVATQPAPQPARTTKTTPAPAVATKPVTAPAGTATRGLTAEEQDQAELAAIRAAYDSQEKSFADIVAQMTRDQEDQIRQDKSIEDVYRKRAAWTGAAEAASALANLVGTTAGATSQTMPHKTDSWMAEADRQAELRRSRTDSMRQQLRQAEQALAQQKGRGALAVAQQANAMAKQRTAERKADAQIAYQNARTESVYLKQELDRIASDLKVAEQARKNAKTDSDRALAAARINDLTKKQENAKEKLRLEEKRIDASRARSEGSAATPSVPSSPTPAGSIFAEFEE